jgi:uncharacterized membrane protein
MKELPPFFRIIGFMKAHQRFLISFGIGIIALLILRQYVPWPIQLIGAWMSYAFAVLLLMWIAILGTHPEHLEQIARMEDNSRVVFFLIVIGGAAASLLAVLLLLDLARNLARESLLQLVALAGFSVALSWGLLHTVFALRYAHVYYGDNQSGEINGGLEFPGEESPDYLDFVYFSFVIGMTCQVSDVGISSKKMRRLAWLHGVLSFVFNTAIVALGINVFSTVLSSS